MSQPLHIPQEGALDLVSPRLLIHRSLDPGTIPFRKAQPVPDFTSAAASST